jgi:hypothetical protein
MRIRSVRAWHEVVGLALVLGLAACSGTGGNPSPSGGSGSSTKAVPAVDACTLLSAQELANVSLPTQGAPDKTDSEVGCKYTGQRYLVTLAVDPARTVDGYLAGTQNFMHKLDAVNGRRGALIQLADTHDECSQYLELGSGVFAIGLTYKFGQKGDPCADAQNIAKVVEPKLPK